MAKVPTVNIVGDAPGGYVTINADQFDEKVHKLYEGPTEPEPKAPEALKGRLPEDFPGYAALAAAEPPIHTYKQLNKAIADGVKIPGIGDSTLAKINEVLAAGVVEEAPEE